jgi:hypothetical protein
MDSKIPTQNYYSNSNPVKMVNRAKQLHSANSLFNRTIEIYLIHSRLNLPKCPYLKHSEQENRPALFAKRNLNSKQQAHQRTSAEDKIT